MVEERFFSLAKIFLFIRFLDYLFLSNILKRRVSGTQFPSALSFVPIEVTAGQV